MRCCFGGWLKACPNWALRLPAGQTEKGSQKKTGSLTSYMRGNGTAPLKSRFRGSVLVESLQTRCKKGFIMVASISLGTKVSRATQAR